jgi:putative Ca2+/H+ antiporter (TMEM165/GDT1 family)
VPLDDLLAAALLIWFGVQAIRDAGGAADSVNEEKEEAAEVVESISTQDLTKLVLTTFALVFAAEWGDKSFLATIALAAASSPLGVTGGAVAGHGAATALAVAGGSVLTKYVSPSVLQYIGGGLFLLFAASTLFDVAVEMSATGAMG